MEGTATASRKDFARLVMLLSAGHLLAFVDRAKLAGAMPAIRRQVVMSDTAAGWIIGTAFALGYGVTVLAMAALRRDEPARWSWRLPAGVGLWAMASLATGLAASVPALLVARILVGSGQALFIPAAVSWIVADGDRVGARTTGLATFTASASLGRSAGLLAIGLAIALVGWAGAGGPAAWRWSFVLTALPNLVLLALVTARRPGDAVFAPPSGDDRLGPTGWARSSYLALALLPIIVLQAFGGWLPTLFVLDRGVTPQAAAGWLGGLTLVGGAGGQLLAGWLIQRVPGWQRAVPLVIVGGMAAALPAMALIGWGPGGASATLGVLAADLSLGLASFAALFGWQMLIPERGRVAGNGLFFALITVVGVGLGPLLTGVLTDHGPALRAALMTTAIGCTIVAALVALVAQPLYRKHGLA